MPFFDSDALLRLRRVRPDAAVLAPSGLNRSWVFRLGRGVAAGACAAAIVGASACTPFDTDRPIPQSEDGRPGSSGGASEATSPCDPSQPFGNSTFVLGLTGLSATWVGGLSLSPDLLTGYYHANGPNAVGNTDLYVARRSSIDTPFDDFEPLPGAGINTPEFETSPTVSGDGLTLVFQRSIDGISNHLYYATRASASDSFSFGGPLTDIAAPGANDSQPFLLENGSVLYFTSDRGPSQRGLIYRSNHDGSGPNLGFSPPEPVAELDIGLALTAPVATPDDLTLYFSTSGAEEAGQAIWIPWMATRSSATAIFSGLTQLAPVDTAVTGDVLAAQPSFATGDGCTLYYYTYAWSTSIPYGAEMQYVVQKPSN